MHHHLSSSPETVHWGWFDAALPHVLTVESGDRVTIESVSGTPANLPGDGFHIPLGVSPPKGWGSISSIEPRVHGGNLDNKHLIPGATLYLPVHNEGAGFSVGDGHAVQGDGEVCVTAIETALKGTFELHVRSDLKFDYPAAETQSHLIAMGMDPNLDTAAKDALRRMVDRVVQATGLSRNRAFMLMSLVADVHVTQLVNGHKGIHVMMPKTALQKAS